MRKILLILTFFFTSAITIAQSRDSEAKAAYMLAEESYGKGDYKKTLEFLRQVREVLGGTNCKVLYLQIMATRELYTKDTSSNNHVLSLISEFEKSPDYANFNEEKSLEISKLKLLIKDEQKTTREELNRLAELKIAREKRLDSIAKSRTSGQKAFFINKVTQIGPFNITLDELDKTNPKWKVKKWIAEKLSPTVELYHHPELYFNAADFPFPYGPKANFHDGHIVGVYIKDGKITGYYVLEHYLNNVNIGTNFYNWLVGQTISNTKLFSAMHQLDPIITPFSTTGATANRYQWTEGKYGYMIEEMHYPKDGGGIVKVVGTYFYNPTEKETATYHPSEK